MKIRWCKGQCFSCELNEFFDGGERKKDFRIVFFALSPNGCEGQGRDENRDGDGDEHDDDKMTKFGLGLGAQKAAK